MAEREAQYEPGCERNSQKCLQCTCTYCTCSTLCIITDIVNWLQRRIARKHMFNASIPDDKFNTCSMICGCGCIAGDMAPQNVVLHFSRALTRAGASVNDCNLFTRSLRCCKTGVPSQQTCQRPMLTGRFSPILAPNRLSSCHKSVITKGTACCSSKSLRFQDSSHLPRVFFYILTRIILNQIFQKVSVFP